MKGYGTCPSCLGYKYLNAKICKNCSYVRGNCLTCKREAKIIVDGLCYLCYQNRQVLPKIKKMEESFIPLNDYNKELFYLYLSYVKRYNLQYSQVKMTAKLTHVLQQETMPVIKSWHDVFQLSDHYSIMQRPVKKQGCVFIKIGNMLSELGVLPPRENDLDHLIDHNLSFFFTAIVKDYIQVLLKINTAQSTIIHYLETLLKLEHFTKKAFNISSLLQVNSMHITQFFDQEIKEINSLNNKRKFFYSVKRFYSWAIFNKHIIINPVSDIKLGRPPGRLVVCSEEQLFQIKNYIKNENSNTERAFLLTIILFFGFSTQQLAQSQIVIQEDKVCIKLKRNKLTKGKKYYRRKEFLQLPQNPKWFLELQKRFFIKWSEHYKKVKKTFPNRPLILPLSNLHNRYLNTSTIITRVRAATIEATGSAIPIRVLRQTCGHLYSVKADSSILSSLGWSEQFAFNYTWLPRTYYQKNEKSRID